jgi:hypothetical protein
MSCREMRRLEEAQKMHGEAALYLSCEAAGLRKTIATNKMLARLCRADQARAVHAIAIHRYDCPTCKEPS